MRHESGGFVVSVTLWVLRTFFRYSNKLARYDLTVNKFLTSKISHRGPGVLRYIAAEAGSQRAVRASLTHAWLAGDNAMEGGGYANGDLLTREEIAHSGMDGVNGLIGGDRQSRVNVEAALDDLEEIGLVRFEGREEASAGSKKDSKTPGAVLREIRTGAAAEESLKAKWEALF